VANKHGGMNIESGYGGINGGCDMKPPRAHGPAPRRQLNCLSLILALLLPVALFVGTLCTMSFGLYYRHPNQALLIVAAAFFFTLVLGAFSLQSKRDEIAGHQMRTWHGFIFRSSVLACCLGFFLGYVNMNWNAIRYYDYISLRKAVDVEPGQFQGQELLDVGEVDFKAGTKIDRSLHSLWHKGHTWCVAPIISKDGAKLASYDFWAVGMDCCSSKSGDFSCGPVHTSSSASGEVPSGLRVVETEEIQGYKLAVDQALSAHNIQSQRPIFLKMMHTPYLTIKGHFDDAKVFAILSCSGFFVMQFILVATQAFSFGKGALSV